MAVLLGWLERYKLDAYDCDSSAANPSHVLAIAHSLLLDLAYGTLCQPSCESRTFHSDYFDEHSKRIYLVTDSSYGQIRVLRK